jgi:hypothetical protein
MHEASGVGRFWALHSLNPLTRFTVALHSQVEAFQPW